MTAAISFTTESFASPNSIVVAARGTARCRSRRSRGSSTASSRSRSSPCRRRGSASRRSGSPCRCARPGSSTSLAPITSATSVCGNSGLISSISLSCVVRHVRLGEEDVHVARHAARDGVDRVLDVDALRLEQLGELAHVVLRLRDGHAVAGDDDDLAGERRAARRRPRGSSRARCARRRARAAPAPRLHLPERAEQHVRDRAVHRLRHHQREQGARGADEHPGDDQDGRVEHEAGRGRRRGP